MTPPRLRECRGYEPTRARRLFESVGRRNVEVGMADEGQWELFEASHLAGLEHIVVDGEVRIVMRGVPLLAFSADDPVQRDFVVATLLQAGLQGKSVAELCRVSQGHVSGVRARVRAGGVEALAVRGRPGQPRKLTGSKLTKLRRLYDAGVTQKAMATKLGVHASTVRDALRGLGLPTKLSARQAPLMGIGGVSTSSASSGSSEAVGDGAWERRTYGDDEHAGAEDVGEVDGSEPILSAADVDGPGDEEPTSAEPEAEELQPGAELPAGPTEHPTRYAGTLLLAAAMGVLGVGEAMAAANARRAKTAIYDARQMVIALACAWVAGFKSLESMHERDARGLGVVLGLERSPSVRTAHRAIAEMVAQFDPVALGTGLMRGLRRAGGELPLLFGIDGHFKEYSGDAPIDKGWNPHKRMATKGLAVMLVHGVDGATWLSLPTAAGDAVSQHVLSAARRLRHVHGPDAPIVLGFDRGGFCFETLRALDEQGFGYLAWVPANAKTPPLAQVAPREDGVGAVPWKHDKLGHAARLIVQRDGDALLPAVTNLGPEVEPAEALRQLRLVRGVEENAIKSARASVHIDQLVDRGIARQEPDGRLVPNPERKELRRRKKQLEQRLAALDEHEQLTGRRDRAIEERRFIAELEEAVVNVHLSKTPAQLPRTALEPDAVRAWLRTKNRSLLVPLKLAADNARRWLLATLDSALAPTDNDYDATAKPRTLAALLRAPGTVRFGDDRVIVTLELPLPPTAHARLTQALRTLDESDLCFPDKVGPDRPQPRRVVFRLAPRPTRDSLPHVAAGAPR